MFIFEWIGSGGKIVRYSDDVGIVEIIDGVESEPRAATAEELAFVESSRPAPEYNEIELLRNKMRTSLNTLRGITADSRVTKEEVGLAIQQIIPTLEAYRDFGRFDRELSVLQDLLGDQVMLALLIISQQVEAGLKVITTQLYNVEERLMTLESQ